jgi:hypothetical protein
VVLEGTLTVGGTPAIFSSAGADKVRGRAGASSRCKRATGAVPGLFETLVEWAEGERKGQR